MLSQNRLAGGAFVLAVTQFGASFVGLIRESVLNHTFPPESGIVDAYIASFRLSDLLFQVSIMSAIGTVLVPLLANYHAKEDTTQTENLLSGTMGAGALLFGSLALVIAIFFPWIAPHLVEFEGEQLQLYITFGRLALFINFLFVFGNAVGQYFITIQRYWIYGLTPIFYTLGTIAGALFLTPYFGTLSPMIGTSAGAVLYVLWRFYGLYMSGIRLRAKIWHPDLQQMGILMLPRMLALGALQLQLLFFDRIASTLDVGSITINANARNFESVIVGVVGIAIAQSTYPLMSDALARGDTKRFWLYVLKGSRLLLAVTVPAAILLWLCAPIAAKLVGLTSVMATFTVCIGLYAIATPFESINHLLLRAYYSMKNTKTPAMVSMMGTIVAVSVAAFFSRTVGVYGIAIGFVIGQVVQAVGLGLLLKKQQRSYF